jgi:hypothetical protein
MSTNRIDEFWLNSGVSECERYCLGRGGQLGERTITLNVENNSWRQELVPAINHPDHPPRIDLSDEWQ